MEWDNKYQGTVEDWLTEKYVSVGIRTAGELLLQRADALRYLEDCERMGQALLGLDFWIDEHSEIPGPDFSSLAFGPQASAQTIAATRRAVLDWWPHDAKWVSFVLKGE